MNLCDSCMEEVLHFIYHFGNMRELQVFSTWLFLPSDLYSLVLVREPARGCCQLLNVSIPVICPGTGKMTKG